ncbi:MAG: hypothetical protein AAGK14_10870 [Verrucomicrobiota bacterium]
MALAKATEWYARHHPTVTDDMTVEGSMQELLFSKAKDGASKRHLEDLCLEEGHVWVRAAKAKTSQNRHVPIGHRLRQLSGLILTKENEWQRFAYEGMGGKPPLN